MNRFKRFPVCIFLAINSLCGTAAAGDNILLGERNPDAPEGLEQFGQFAGTWTCTPGNRQPDGTFKDAPFKPKWIWSYALNGTVIQDIWKPNVENAPPGSVMGTNLRVYDPESDAWEMVWTTETLGGFQTFESKMEEGNMVMRGDLPAGAFPAHMVRITFHNISENYFDWSYEASAPGDGENWQLQSTLACDREL